MKKYLPFIPYVVGIALAVLGGVALWREAKNLQDAILPDPAPADTVFVGDTLVQTIVRRGNEVEKVTVVDRIVTQEIKPDTVYVSHTDTVIGELPAWAIQEVLKEKTRLTVDVLSRNGQDGQRLVYNLPSDDSDFRLRSGNQPATLRADREFDLLRLEVSGEVTAGVNLITNTPTVIGQIRGPVSVGIGGLRLSPSATLVNKDLIVGGTLKF